MQQKDRMAKRKSRSKAASESAGTDLLAQLAGLGSDGRTGTLHIDRPRGARIDVHLMMGSIIAASGQDDDKALGRILVATGVIDPDALETITMDIKGDEDFADLLVGAGAVPGDRMMAAGRMLFHDNLARALGPDGAAAEFEEQDAVFPSNMQLGLDRDELLHGVAEWKGRAAAFPNGLGEDGVHAATGDCPDGTSPAVWERLAQARPLSELIELVGTSYVHAAEMLAAWLESGAVAPAEEDDYAKAARGGFVKSYEVLDKVDLQGVAIIGAEAPAPPSGSSMEAIEAVAMDDEDFEVELGDGESADMEALIADDSADVAADVDADGDYDPDDEPTMAAARPNLEQTRPDQAALRPDAPPPGSGDTSELGDDDFAIFDGGPSSGELDAVIDETGSIKIGRSGGPFTREQLNEFEGRIKVFNNIFRVIFETFAEHITEEKSIQRFNALLGSGQRQYPELFRDLSVGEDGTVPTSPLINNLAECPPGDYGALLHQGLYELIFSHLYDAKDMLPGEAESEMMEKIVIFERQLHQM